METLAASISASFTVQPASGQDTLALKQSPEFRIEQKGGRATLFRTPSGRYAAEDEWEFVVSDPNVTRQPGLVLEVEFWDEGFGVIQAQRLVDDSFNGRYANPARAVSYTRLNSRSFRKAAFAFTQAPGHPLGSDRTAFKLTGAQYIAAARILSSVDDDYWQSLTAAIPMTAAHVSTLRHPMDIVCSAGVEVLGDPMRDRDGMLERSIANLRELLPLAKALGFNGIEAYVRWNLVESQPGVFDWSYYDRIVEEVQKHGLKLFPLLIVGSAYALPQWFFNSEESVGFVCLEHGIENPVQSIWSPYQRKHVTRFLRSFGEHYEPMGCLLGVRLGPSGCYGESQYPAQGDWGVRGEHMHLHIGMWCGDKYARADFQERLRAKYATVESLNQAWLSSYGTFDDVRPILPEQCVSRRQRVDLFEWYTDSMSAWCEWWALEARKVMPNTPIYQSAGGWGAAEIGTDYSAQAKSMVKIGGGIRLTNELDSFHQCFYATRLATTAARHYAVPLGFEPAMGHTARGTAGRIFNCVANGGRHFFTYHGNVFNRQTSIANWIRHYPLFNRSRRPRVDIALMYPQTMNFLTQDTFRYLNAWGFNTFAREIRDRIEVDYLDERLILDGFLEDYKVLVFVWGNCTESAVVERIDAWLRNGGTVIFPCHLWASLATVEGDTATFERWNLGDVGNGAFHRYSGDDEPPSLYADFVQSRLREMDSLARVTRVMLEMEKPDKVFASASDTGLLILNFSNGPARVYHDAFGERFVEPYAIAEIEGISEP